MPAFRLLVPGGKGPHGVTYRRTTLEHLFEYGNGRHVRAGDIWGLTVSLSGFIRFLLWSVPSGNTTIHFHLPLFAPEVHRLEISVVDFTTGLFTVASCFQPRARWSVPLNTPWVPF